MKSFKNVPMLFLKEGRCPPGRASSLLQKKHRDVLKTFHERASPGAAKNFSSQERPLSFFGRASSLLQYFTPAGNPFCARILRPSPGGESPASFKSASTMMRTRSRKETFASQPRSFLALEASATRFSTSVGRKC